MYGKGRTEQPRISGTLQAARKGDTCMLERLLGLPRQQDVSAFDETGKTALHYAVISGNLENVKLLLHHNAPVNQADKTGRTPLHYASVKGLVSIIKYLVHFGADIDIPDKRSGRSALHYVVEQNDSAGVALLLFAGADVLLTDKRGDTPLTLCKNPLMLRKLNESQRLAVGKRCGDVHVETKLVEDGKTSHFRNVGIKIKYDNSGLGDAFPLTIRRQTNEYSDVDIKVEQIEDLYSDFFVFRSERTRSTCNVRLLFPVFQRPDPGEDVIFKTDRGYTETIKLKYIKPKHDDNWACTLKLDMSTFEVFCLTTRPKRDQFEITDEPAVIQSTVDERVEVDIPADTFDSPTHISMELLEGPTVHDKEIDDILSATPFLGLHCDGCDTFSKDVTLRLPLPSDFEGSGAVKVFSSSDEDADEEDDWEMLDTQVTYEDKRIAFPVRSFSIKVGLEVSCIADVACLKKQVCALYAKAKRRERSVVFLSMIKQIDTCSFNVLVECTLLEKFQERKQYWMDEGFQDQKPSQSGEFNAYAKQAFVLGLSEHIHMVCDQSDLTLEFHPKRQNFHCLPVEVQEDDKRMGAVTISRQEKQPVVETNISSDDDNTPSSVTLLTVMTIRFPKPEVEEEPTSGSSSTEEEDDGLPYHGFVNDLFLNSVANELLEDDWYKICLLMGVRFWRIEEILQDDSRDYRMKAQKMLDVWRQKNKRKEDLGLPRLLSAVAKAGRMDIKMMINVQMKLWMNQSSTASDDFKDWLNRAMSGSTVMTPDDYPKPMSDAFFVLLLESLGTDLNLVESLGVTKEQMDTITESPWLNTPELKMIKALIFSRGRRRQRTKAFERLVEVLGKSDDLAPASEWALLTSRAWLETNKDSEDVFVETMHYLMKSIDAMIKQEETKQEEAESSSLFHNE